jgi:hypothetical protein
MNIQRESDEGQDAKFVSTSWKTQLCGTDLNSRTEQSHQGKLELGSGQPNPWSLLSGITCAARSEFQSWLRRQRLPLILGLAERRHRR